ncbi:MAG: hypothetical protein WA821_24105 [Anaerolineales bacterium]
MTTLGKYELLEKLGEGVPKKTSEVFETSDVWSARALPRQGNRFLRNRPVQTRLKSKP